MAWSEPQYSKTQVDRAGASLVYPAVSPDELSVALAVVNNWRSSHSFPLNTLQVGLRQRARQVDPEALIAQRIKRLSSIEAKLKRFRTMKLSQMQDIGGCRAVVRTVAQVQELAELYRQSGMKHKLLRVDDYLAAPQSSGYRGIHLIYRYFSDRSETYNGLQIEVQLRSLLQHAWATAVETVGTFLKQALKSSQGHAEWLRFFALMGSALALRERTALVPGTPTARVEVLDELRARARELDVERRLEAYGNALQTLEDQSIPGAHFFLLALDPAANTITIRGYRRNDLDRATAEYLEVERAIDSSTGAEAVLVSVDSIAALKRAYPNYFLDTQSFLIAVRRALGPTGR
jgi:Region found in RelA / SpoT proteins